jgi:hypothetical protein
LPLCQGEAFLLEVKSFDDRYGEPNALACCGACGYLASAPRLREFDLPTLYGTYNPHKNIGANVVVFEAAKVTRAFAGDLATSVPNVSWESCLQG